MTQWQVEKQRATWERHHPRRWCSEPMRAPSNTHKQRGRGKQSRGARGCRSGASEGASGGRERRGVRRVRGGGRGGAPKAEARVRRGDGDGGQQWKAEEERRGGGRGAKKARRWLLAIVWKPAQRRAGRSGDEGGPKVRSKEERAEDTSERAEAAMRLVGADGRESGWEGVWAVQG
jgi:hypothetical protein